MSPHRDVCVLPLSPCAAFNIETANIRSTTSTVEIGRMRLMWWRQAIEQGRAGKPPDHPVAQALAQAQARHSLSFRFLEQLLDAREADLETKQPADLRQLLSYCERTAGALQVGGQTLYSSDPQGPRPAQHEHPHLPCASQLLGLECAGVVDNEQAELAAVHVGCALGLATLLRGTAHHASKGCTYIPADVASRHSVDLSQVPRSFESQPARRPRSKPPSAHRARQLCRRAPARPAATPLPGTAGRVFACASRRGGGARHRGRDSSARRKEPAADAPRTGVLLPATSDGGEPHPGAAAKGRLRSLRGGDRGAQWGAAAAAAAVERLARYVLA